VSNISNNTIATNFTRCVPVTFIHVGNITSASVFFRESLQISSVGVNKIKTPDTHILHANSRQVEIQLFLSQRRAIK